MRKINVILSTLCALAIFINPLLVSADPEPITPTSPLIITEVQPGSSASASEEFIELYNTTTQPLDLAAFGWRVEMASSTATSWENPYRSVPLTGSIQPGQSILIASEYKSSTQTTKYLSDAAVQWFSAGMAATAGHVRLVYETYAEQDSACVLTAVVADEVEWSGSTDGQPVADSLSDRSMYVDVTAKSINSRFSLQRLMAAAGYADTDNDAADFSLANPTPGGLPAGVTVAPAVYGEPPAHSCDPAPAPPALPSEPSEPPEVTPPSPGDGSDDPDTEKEPEEESPAAPNQGLLPAQISELLPNPAPPRTDAADEYIELYNPNAQPFSLSGYTLEAGETTKRRYTFPDDVVLPPQTYVAFYANSTGLSLSNEAGRVHLVDPAGAVVASSDVYSKAPDDKAWVYQAGMWQWSATATPNAPNILFVPPAGVKAASVAKKPAAATKTTTAKAAKPPSTKAASQAKQPADIAATASASGETRRPIHGTILVVIGVFAVLYGAYEYRHDLANKIHQLRSYRAARRKTRQSA